MRINRKEILAGEYRWREGLIPLLYSKHAKNRLAERIKGELVVFPTVLRITKDNIYNAETGSRVNRLISACIKIEYKKDEWMFLVISIWNGVVKSVWIRKKNGKIKQKTTGLREEMGIISENLVKEIPQITGFWQRFRKSVEKYLLRSSFRTSKVS